MEESDQDIDIAGTEADPAFRQRDGGRPDSDRDSTATDAATPEHTPTERGSEPGSLHRAEDDDAARSRSPEFHDLPGSGKHKTV